MNPFAELAEAAAARPVILPYHGVDVYWYETSRELGVLQFKADLVISGAWCLLIYTTAWVVAQAGWLLVSAVIALARCQRRKQEAA